MLEERQRRRRIAFPSVKRDDSSCLSVAETATHDVFCIQYLSDADFAEEERQRLSY